MTLGFLLSIITILNMAYINEIQRRLENAKRRDEQRTHPVPASEALGSDWLPAWDSVFQRYQDPYIQDAFSQWTNAVDYSLCPNDFLMRLPRNQNIREELMVRALESLMRHNSEASDDTKILISPNSIAVVLGEPQTTVESWMQEIHYKPWVKTLKKQTISDLCSQQFSDNPEDAKSISFETEFLGNYERPEQPEDKAAIGISDDVVAAAVDHYNSRGQTQYANRRASLSNALNLGD